MRAVGSAPGRPDHAALAALVAENEASLVALRRDLHAHPELSWNEHRTTSALVERLAAAGLEPRVAPTGTGVLCDIGTTGPLVALRGDIDALPLTDTKAVPYRSMVDGACHACGHDVHTAATLGAGLALARHLEATGQPGRVRLIFQPAEEAVPGGAVSLVAEGVMHGVEAIFALHCDPTLEVGHVGVAAGPITSAADQLDIVLHGRGGHTGRPHRTADLVHIAARVVVDLPMSLGRLSDPRDGLNVTFGAIHAGDAPNVIPTEARLLGSLRASGRGAWEAAPALIPKLLAAIIEPLGATWELDHRVGAPPIVNDAWAVGLVERAADQVVGPGGVGPTAQSAGGEDFAWYADHAPSGYLRLGVRPPGGPEVDIHASSFDVDERAIAIGARLLAGAAAEALAELA
ncbi:MAG: amidohydrolase [Acidimicrobiales bacterium]|nr:amidohydrolase [Acidimicrobiales bacterium]